MTQQPHIAFIGLGTMGGPMAAHLVRAGYQVTAYNRNPARAHAWATALTSEGFAAHTATSIADAVAASTVIITCVGNDDDLREVIMGPEGAASSLSPGSLLIDHSTVSPTAARAIAQFASERGCYAVDAPVSGGQSGAENGVLSVMCGGTAEAVARATPLMESYSARIVRIGDAGSGQSAKAVNQICIAGTLAGLSEALRFAQSADLDMNAVFEAISGGAAQSWQMTNRWDSMAQDSFDFGFAVDWMRKDLAIALAEARQTGVSLPATAMVDQLYAQVQAMGGGRQDTSALVRHLPAITKAPQ